MALPPDRLRCFPKLVAGEYEKTSDESDEYNCIAWAAGDTTRPWWPRRLYYWPSEAPFGETLDAFVTAFRLLGYEPCDNAELEEQYEKVAIFIDQDRTPTHAAIQRPSGKWSSKLGEWEDIEHELHGIECPDYGMVEVVLRRLRGG